MRGALLTVKNESHFLGVSARIIMLAGVSQSTYPKKKIESALSKDQQPLSRNGVENLPIIFIVTQMQVLLHPHNPCIPNIDSAAQH